MVHLGGQRRTISCACGWSNIGLPDRLNTIFRLHKKKCGISNKSTYKPSDTKFDYENGMNNLKVTKNGNYLVSPNITIARDFTTNTEWKIKGVIIIEK